MKAIALAFDSACKALGGPPEIIRDVVARQILEAAQSGERDSEKLCVHALKALEGYRKSDTGQAIQRHRRRAGRNRADGRARRHDGRATDRRPLCCDGMLRRPMIGDQTFEGRRENLAQANKVAAASKARAYPHKPINRYRCAALHLPSMRHSEPARTLRIPAGPMAVHRQGVGPTHSCCAHR
jgi:hypothetical protein